MADVRRAARPAPLAAAAALFFSAALPSSRPVPAAAALAPAAVGTTPPPPSDLADPELSRYVCAPRPAELAEPPFKVVGVGFKKTGTTSLGKFLTSIGFGPKMKGVPRRDIERLFANTTSGYNWTSLLRASSACHAYEDSPFCCQIEAVRAMNEALPSTRFILTTRAEDAWYASVTNWVTVVWPGKRGAYERLLGGPLEFERAVSVLRRHNSAVRRLLAGTGRLFEVDLAATDPWNASAAICEFLGVPGRQDPECACAHAFPHRNFANTSAGSTPHGPLVKGPGPAAKRKTTRGKQQRDSKSLSPAAGVAASAGRRRRGDEEAQAAAASARQCHGSQS